MAGGSSTSSSMFFGMRGEELIQNQQENLLEAPTKKRRNQPGTPSKYLINYTNFYLFIFV